MVFLMVLLGLGLGGGLGLGSRSVDNTAGRCVATGRHGDLFSLWNFCESCQ